MRRRAVSAIKARRVFLSDADWRRAMRSAVQCSHGVAGGHYVRPTTGEAVCKYCEHGAPPQLGLFPAAAVNRGGARR